MLGGKIAPVDEIDKMHTKMTFNQLIVELEGLKQKKWHNCDCGCSCSRLTRQGFVETWTI
jgi:hypothetical protein